MKSGGGEGVCLRPAPSTALSLHSELGGRGEGEGLCPLWGRGISTTPLTRLATGLRQSWQDPPQPLPCLPQGDPDIQAPPSWCYRPCPGAHTPLARKPSINKVLSCVDFRVLICVRFSVSESHAVPTTEWKRPCPPPAGGPHQSRGACHQHRREPSDFTASQGGTQSYPV